MLDDGLIAIGWNVEHDGPIAVGQVVTGKRMRAPDKTVHVIAFRVVREATFDEWRRCASEFDRGRYRSVDELPYAAPRFYAVAMD